MSRWSDGIFLGSGGSRPPLLAFTSAEEFVKRHEEATLAEFHVEAQVVEEFNNKKYWFQAWVITAPTATSPHQSFVLRVDASKHAKLMPAIGQSCMLGFAANNLEEPTWFYCRRGPEVMTMNDSWDKFMELIVNIPKDEANRLKQYLKPLLGDASWKAEAKQLRHKQHNPIAVRLRFEASASTMKGELRALNRLMNGNASQKGKDAFAYLLNFRNPRRIVDFGEIFPHMVDLKEISDPDVRRRLEESLAGFDEDQEKAYKGLRALPAATYFVPGGPGAGKTWWTLTMTALAQAGARSCRALYLLDINSAADDAADRMQGIYQTTGVNKAAVRLTGWPSGRPVEEEVLENSTVDQAQVAFGTRLECADFTEGFIRERNTHGAREETKAPNLDQAAWDLYNQYPEQYNDVTFALWRLFNNTSQEKNRATDLEYLRTTLLRLYQQVIASADFIATTPIQALRLFGVFRPDLVIFDECAHARESNTMISVAYFEPKAWLFVGDHRQTEPYTAGQDHQFVQQLRVSTMERADANGAANNQLLVNHRAYGGLERMASSIFYGGAMRSDKSGDELFPPSVCHLRNWLKSLTTGKRVSGTLRTPRLIVDFGRADTKPDGTSTWNPTHFEFVMDQVEALMMDPQFLDVGGKRKGNVIILSPYKAAVNKYLGAVNQLKGKKLKQRVLVRTVDTAQGQEADVVFLDMVNKYATTHTENPKRLCVATTRARQAEIIVMSKEMKNSRDGRLASKIWSACEKGNGQIVHM
ncbi:P-loop containing nucleoside triphosphate hydrolase protein [Podospora australis]|uniref:P-loop containing nucleoside triphosphate hydrolase protein n=1 Tax=Podospora australis TaxID=1536484 RepID=A0AAN7ANC3_9PEZI|nr:P-loop containing nucleoside triphosphate hydrolase protein [Podospora australis]